MAISSSSALLKSAREGSRRQWRGTRGQVRVEKCVDDYWRQIITVPIALWVDVRLAKQIVRYRGKVEVRSRFRLRLDPPCAVTVELEQVQEHTSMQPLIRSAWVLDSSAGWAE